jgi:hypothetical protein
MATLATLRSSVAAKLGLDNTASSAEQVLIDQWVTEGINEILLRTQCTVVAGTIAASADVWQQDLAADVLAIRDIWREDAAGAIDPVLRVSEQEILDKHRSSTSSDAAYTRYAISGGNLLLLWPTPSAAYTLKTLYVAEATAMTAGSHSPATATYGGIPTEFHKAIEYYALWQGAEFDENRGSQGGERYRTLFENYLVGIIRPAMRRKGGLDMPQVRRGSWRSKRLLARENDRW